MSDSRLGAYLRSFENDDGLSLGGDPRDQERDVRQEMVPIRLVEYNTKRPHQGPGKNGRTPITAFIDGVRKENTPPPNPIRKAA